MKNVVGEVGVDAGTDVAAAYRVLDAEQVVGDEAVQEVLFGCSSAVRLWT